MISWCLLIFLPDFVRFSNLNGLVELLVNVNEGANQLRLIWQALSHNTKQKCENEISTEEFFEITTNHDYQVTAKKVNSNALWQSGGFKFFAKKACYFLAWLCLEDRWRRFEALPSSSTLVSLFTRLQMSCGDISPSLLHLILENSAGAINSK